MGLYYTLSREADHDLEEVFDYTFERYGMDRAVSYVNDFETIFDQLVVNPNLGRDRSIIRKGLRSITKEKHVIFYRQMQTHIRIIRVLHCSRDLPISFPEE